MSTIIISLHHIQYLIIDLAMSANHIGNRRKDKKKKSYEKANSTDNEPGSIWSCLKLGYIVIEKDSKKSESYSHKYETWSSKKNEWSNITNGTQYDHDRTHDIGVDSLDYS